MPKLLYASFSLLIFCSTFVFAGMDYIPSDLSTFTTTGNCENCNLTNASLPGSQHQEANLQNSDISYASTMVFSDYTRANFSAIKGVAFTAMNTDLSEVNFTNAQLINANFANSNLGSADFTGANLTGADFANANLLVAKITATQLASAGNLCRAVLPDGSQGGC